MKLELPDNNASVLFHMGNALQSIARDIDTSLTVNGHKATHTETVEPTTTMSDVTNMVKASLDEVLERGLIEPLITPPEVEFTEQQAIDHMSQPTDTIDADGLPWDQRINSKSRTRVKGDVWRTRQKPNDKTDKEWAEYVEGVKTELKALMAIPVAVTYDPNEADPFAIEPPVVDAVVTPRTITVNLPGVVHAVEINGTLDFPPIVDSATFEAVANGDIGAGQPVRMVTPPVVDAVIAPPVVIEAPEVVTPPVVDAVIAPPVDAAVIAPPVDAAVIAPPVDAAVATGPTTFPELMKFITVNNKKLTKESVDEALKAQGLASIALLAARTDLIPQVHSALVKLL